MSAIKTPVTAKEDPVSGFWYILDKDGKIVARSNSQIEAAEIVEALNSIAALRAELAEARGLLEPFASPGKWSVADLRRAAAFLAKTE
jgi:hypothetical protein